MARKILITGAASGLGKALAVRYVQQGDQVCIADINADAAKALVAELNAQGGKSCFQPCDITDAGQIDDLKRWVSEHWGQLDVLINNAGVATAGHLEFEDMEQWQWVMNINLLGQVSMTREFVGLLRKGDKPEIINIASQAGITPIAMMGSYNASKAAMVSFSETMHLELAKDKIHVSVACPGFFSTNLDKSLRSKEPGMAQLVSKMLHKSDITAEQVADQIVRQSAAGKFMIITHPQGRTAYRLKRYLPTRRYLNMIKNKFKSFGPKP